MAEFKSKYSGKEIEQILDKVKSIEVGVSDKNAIEFDTLKIDNITYKIPKEKQLGLFKHTIRFGIFKSGDNNPKHISIDGSTNEISFDVYTTSSTPLTISNAFNAQKTLSFYNIKYDLHITPVNMYHAIMTSVHSDMIDFLYSDSSYGALNNFNIFYIRNFTDTVVEVNYGD